MPEQPAKLPQDHKKITKRQWDSIFAALEKWKEEITLNMQTPLGANASSGVHMQSADPSVSTVAQHYRFDPWAVLISTIISLRTKDEVTIVSSQRLLDKAPSPQDLIKFKQSSIEKLIYPAGFYRNKAASMLKIAEILINQYNGKVPNILEDLLALPGVGRKTANLVLNEAFDLDAICVDIHVHRISNRCGWLESHTPEETEMVLREILPVKYWKRINYLLVLYGQKLCRPVSPYCSLCVIRKQCSRNGVEKSR